MKRILFSLAALLAVAAASAADVGIASGQPSGTNYPMAANIATVCSTSTAPINNVLSDGSIDNIFKIHTDKSTQYGIVQADALEYQRGIDPHMMKKILMVFPFFSTEMHLVTKDGSAITNLSQLAGKRVIEGPEGSGTWVSAQVIKKLTGLQWIGFFASHTDGMKAIQTGEADAMLIVAGKPVGIISKSTGIKLVPMAHPKLDSFGLYTKTMISTGTYPFQKTAINTYKVDNVLATFAYKSQYQKEINDLVTCITRNIDRLQTEAGFHAKWRDVNPLDIDRITWPAHPAAVAAIKREAKR